MPHTFEAATTGRAKCRGCGLPLEKGVMRFGERLPNPFGSGEVTHWFHPICAAFKRPEAVQEALATTDAIPERERLAAAAARGVEHPRLARIDGVERSPSSQASCRHCRNPIPKGEWRIRLVFHEDARFVPAGFVHLACADDYFGTEEIFERLLHFSPELDNTESAALASAMHR